MDVNKVDANKGKDFHLHNHPFAGLHKRIVKEQGWGKFFNKGGHAKKGGPKDVSIKNISTNKVCVSGGKHSGVSSGSNSHSSGNKLP